MLKSQADVDDKTANQIVQIVTGYLEKSLPAPLDKNVEKMLSGKMTSLSDIPGLGQSGGGLLGKLFGGGKK